MRSPNKKKGSRGSLICRVCGHIICDSMNGGIDEYGKCLKCLKAGVRDRVKLERGLDDGW